MFFNTDLTEGALSARKALLQSGAKKLLFQLTLCHYLVMTECICVLGKDQNLVEKCVPAVLLPIKALVNEHFLKCQINQKNITDLKKETSIKTDNL